MVLTLLRRFALFGAGWLLASVIIFCALRLLPGDTAQVIAGTGAAPERVAQIRASLGLDAPLWEQYTTWIVGVFTGDLGTSLVSQTPISQLLTARAAVSLPLIVLGSCGALLIALPLGVWTGYRAGRPAADSVAAVGFAGAAVPPVWLSLLVISVFAAGLKLFPSQGFPSTGWGDPVTAVRSLLLPGLVIALVDAAVLFRFVRSATLTAVRSAPVRTGMSFGYTRFGALLRYGLPQASLSLIGTFGVQLASLLVGTIVVERIFNLPGVGTLLVTAVSSRDLPLVASCLLVITGVILCLGFVLDISQRLLDPRLRAEARA